MRYISILRGINVGGHKKIKMTDLKDLYCALGLKNVETYIQTGNVIFSSEDNNEQLKTRLEQAINQHFGFEVPVIVRSNNQFNTLLSSLPFEGLNIEDDGTKVLLTFLSAQPNAELVRAIAQYVVAPEQLVIDGATAYLHCPNGYGKTKLTNNFIEKKLQVIATTRNWKSVTKLAQLAND
ncbi:MAG: DUF1697 domain-containing protein [Gammaproteobacteria bacterium]|nr:DUF1697 domain-containing protein [Gammaproteobacteria bacterium]